VLVAVGERAKASVRADDLVARLGGDEIVVVLPTVQGAAGVEAVAAKIQASLAEPVLVDGDPIHTAVSIGIAVAEPGEDAEQVIRHADLALYRAKRSGRDRTVTYDPSTVTAEPTQPSY
jgi:diguanylate cyclase